MERKIQERWPGKISKSSWWWYCRLGVWKRRSTYLLSLCYAGMLKCFSNNVILYSPANKSLLTQTRGKKIGRGRMKEKLGNNRRIHWVFAHIKLQWTELLNKQNKKKCPSKWVCNGFKCPNEACHWYRAKVRLRVDQLSHIPRRWEASVIVPLDTWSSSRFFSPVLHS